MTDAGSTPRDRAAVLADVVDHLLAREVDHPLRVAVDGITAAGKTTTALELAAAVRARGRPAVHLSMDGFHHPSERRHRRGRSSAVGYYEDAYDLEAFARVVLVPLGPRGDLRYRDRVYDLRPDRAVNEPVRVCPRDAVLVVDGSFLQRPELAARWDEVVYLDVAFEVARVRGVRRDHRALGGVGAAGELYDRRYHAAARLYLAEVDPRRRASVVIGHDRPEAPVLVRAGRTTSPDEA